MKKKLLSLLLALCLVMALVPMTAFAADTMDTWDGTADTSWYDEEKTEFYLQTAEQLAGMAKLINDDMANFKDKTVYLENDLDLGGHEWISIGDGANTAGGSFQGVFDGQSHVVYNLYSHEGLKSENKDNNNNLYRNGLFGAIYNATVQNLGIENADIVIPMNDTSTYGKGILVDWMTHSTIKNCYTTGSITGGSYIEKYIGGLAGFLNGNNSISQCYSTAAITGNYDGEYYAEQEGGLEPMDCWDSLGGIVGASYTGQVTISDCWFGGEIVVNSIQAPVGGIIGYGKGVSMVNCLVATKEIGNDGWENTYWLGYVVDKDAKNCFWPNDAKYNSNVANAQSGNSAGTAVDDFMDEGVLTGLNANAAEGVRWVPGIKHPTFDWDSKNIPANYSKVDEAIAKAEALNKDNYKDFTGVEAAVNAVVRDKNITEQSEVDAMAKAIEDAIAALQYKDANYIKIEVPFKLTVKKTGEMDPGKETFKFAIERFGATTEYVLVQDTVETEGEKTYEGKFIFTIKENQAGNLSEGFVIRQVKGNAEGWTYDETKFYVIPMFADTYTNVAGWSFLKYDENAELDYNNPIEEIGFTNSYSAKKPVVPSEPTEPTKPGTSDKNPQTGDTSNMVLWIALLFISGGAAIGTTVVSRKKK